MLSSLSGHGKPVVWAWIDLLGGNVTQSGQLDLKRMWLWLGVWCLKMPGSSATTREGSLGCSQQSEEKERTQALAGIMGLIPAIWEPHHCWTFRYVKWFLTVHDHWVGGFLYLASEVILTDPARHFGKLWEWVLPLKNKLPHQVPKWAYPSLFKYIISPATLTQAIPPCLADFVA